MGVMLATVKVYEYGLMYSFVFIEFCRKVVSVDRPTAFLRNLSLEHKQYCECLSVLYWD